MVKELEDSADEGVLVLLDCDPAGAVGAPPDSSFDAAVRAAGSVLQAYTTRGRAATLLQTGRLGASIRVRSAHSDLGAAVNALAAALPDAPHGLPRFLSGSSLPGGSELTIVTATVEPAAFSAILGLAAHRLVHSSGSMRRASRRVRRVRRRASCDWRRMAFRPPSCDVGTISPRSSRLAACRR